MLWRCRGFKGRISPAPKRTLIYKIIRFRHNVHPWYSDTGFSCKTRESASMPDAICRHLKCTDTCTRGVIFLTRHSAYKNADPSIVVKIYLKNGSIKLIYRAKTTCECFFRINGVQNWPQSANKEVYLSRLLFIISVRYFIH